MRLCYPTLPTEFWTSKKGKDIVIGHYWIMRKDEHEPYSPNNQYNRNTVPEVLSSYDGMIIPNSGIGIFDWHQISLMNPLEPKPY